MPSAIKCSRSFVARRSSDGENAMASLAALRAENRELAIENARLRAQVIDASRACGSRGALSHNAE
jgi:hypothetical protein